MFNNYTVSRGGPGWNFDLGDYLVHMHNTIFDIPNSRINQLVTDSYNRLLNQILARNVDMAYFGHQSLTNLSATVSEVFSLTGIQDSEARRVSSTALRLLIIFLNLLTFMRGTC